MRVTLERAATTGSAIALHGLRKQFGATAAVDGIDLAVPPGAFLVLLGPSGCGKTTTLRMLAGLERPTSGQIRFGHRIVAADDTVLAAGRRNAGLVFQSYALWPHMTVRANVEWPLKVARQPRNQRQRRVEEVLTLLAIDELAARYPGEISGGQQQRVAIARMIAPGPSVLLFDEPLSNLDAKLRVETRAELLRIHQATGATSVYVTHDQLEAMALASHIALMRDGRIEQFGSPAELLAQPATDFVATFMGTPPANLLEATVHGGTLYHDTIPIGPAGRIPEGMALRAMYRAESLQLRSSEARGADIDTRGLEIEYAEITPLAGRFVVSGIVLAVTGRVRRTRVSVVTDTPVHLRPGDPLRVLLPPRPDALFDATTGARLTGHPPAGGGR